MRKSYHEAGAFQTGVCLFQNGVGGGAVALWRWCAVALWRVAGGAIKMIAE